ncbi:hypothetical protein ACQ4PT_007752 [Festuca glaucescens]
MASSSKPPFLIRFGAKCLRKFVDNELNDAKRAMIATSCFADLARISKFHVPEELLEWVVMNIDQKLREYRHKVSKPIVFTRDMMTKVFNVPSGGRPVKRLKNSEHTELRNMYRDGDRAPIAYLERLLRECAADDVVMIKRSFALLAFATVLFLGTNNMVPLDYLGSLLDMNTVDEYAWDEAMLAFCMDQVAEFQEKRRLQKEFVKQNPTESAKQFSIGSCLPALVIVYIDHLDFPVEQLHGHVFDYSVPRALHVCNDDFELAMAIDRNKKTLDIGVFGKRPISCSFLFALHCFLIPVSSLLPPPAPQNVPFVQVQAAYQHPHVFQVQPVAQVPGVPQAQIAPHPPHVAPTYIAPHPPHVAPAQPVLQPSNVSQAQAAAHPFAEVDASVNGSEAFVEPCATLAEWLHKSIPPVGDLGVPSEYNAVYEKHKKLFKHEFSTTLSSFGLVVQGIQCNRMALLLKDKHVPTAVCPLAVLDLVLLVQQSSKMLVLELLQVLSQLLGVQLLDLLSVNPARFVPSLNCLREFNRACDDFRAHKSDLLYFTVVKDHHWILCTINLLHKQINIFDSMKGSKSSEALFRCVDNIIANFATLVKKTKIIKQDIASFARVNLSEYPQQKTNFDCGFFVILYMENFDGKIMKLFGPEYIPIFRKIVAATLFNSPPNEIDAAVAIAALAP